MPDGIQHKARSQLILRAMQEDHAALTAVSPEARASHTTLARLLRACADELPGADDGAGVDRSTLSLAAVLYGTKGK